MTYAIGFVEEVYIIGCFISLIFVGYAMEEKEKKDGEYYELFTVFFISLLSWIFVCLSIGSILYEFTHKDHK